MIDFQTCDSLKCGNCLTFDTYFDILYFFKTKSFIFHLHVSSQVKMWFLMKIVSSQEQVSVPIKWIEKLKMIDLFNYGIAYQKHKKYKIFISKRDEEPNFNAPLQRILDTTREACYIAKIVGVFRNSKLQKYISCIFFKNMNVFMFFCRSDWYYNKLCEQ